MSTSFKPVEAVARALRVLRVVSEEQGATVASIHRATAIDKATIVRMLETLIHEGYVERDLDRAIYSVTGRSMLLSQGYDRSRAVGEIAAPVLEAFRARFGWPSDIALFDQDAMVVVQTSRGSGPLSFNRRPGFRAPMLQTSIGLAYLAFAEASERERVLELLRRDPDPTNALARDPQGCDAVLDDVRGRGFAVMSQAYSDAAFAGAIFAVGVPVRHDDRLYASMNLMLIRSAVSLDEATTRYLPALQEAAAAIGQGLAEAGV